jgi:hypothetical protein
MLGAEFRLPHGEEVSRYVLVHGDVVVLTFNLVDQGAPPVGQLQSQFTETALRLIAGSMELEDHPFPLVVYQA